MLTGLRASDASTLQRLCGTDQRLFLRLGALLQANVAITEAALTEMAAVPALRALVMDARLKSATPAEFAALLAAAGGSGLVLCDDPAEVAPPWRVLAIDDELGNPLLRTALPSTPMAVAVPAAFSALLPTLPPGLRGPVEGLISATADDQRAAALEQLRYAMPPLAVVAELMPMLLADAAELVRERAIGLLVAAGAHAAVVDLVRALQRNDHATIVRLADAVSRLPPMQLDLAVAAALACAGRGQAGQAVVGLCERLAGHLARHPGLDRLLDHLLPTRLSLVGLIRALQSEDTARINAILVRSLGQGARGDAQSIVLLAGPGQSIETALIERGIDLLIAADEEPQERMALANALRRLDRQGLAGRLAGRGSQLALSRDTSVYWLLAELCRDGAVDAATADLLAVLARRLLRDAPGPHVVAILEQQLPALLPARPALKADLVEPLGEVVARYRDLRSRDLVAACLAAIGPAAVPPLWRLLEEHGQREVRLVAIATLPDLVEHDVASTTAAIDRLLAGQSRATDASERAALVTAAARLAAAAAARGDAAALARVDAATGALGDAAIDAVGFLLAAPGLDPGRRLELLEVALVRLMADLPDAPLTHHIDARTQDITFVLDQRLGAHTEDMPRVLAALQRAGSSPHLPPQLLRRLVDRLCFQWVRVASWQVVWGPGNVQELAKVMGQLAQRADFPGPLRLKICEALLPRLNQLSVARSLARVFIAAEGSYLSDLAGKAAARLAKLATDSYYADDEKEELLEVLVDLLAVPHLGTEGDILRRRLAGLIAANRNRLGARARERLKAVAAAADDELRARLDWV